MGPRQLSGDGKAETRALSAFGKGFEQLLAHPLGDA